MLESLCRNDLYKKCQEVSDGRGALVWLKGHKKPVNEFEGFYSWDSGYIHWSDVPLKRAINSPKDSLFKMAWRYVNEKSDMLCDTFIYQTYGNTRKAMLYEKTFDNLWNSFQEWFNAKRSGYMADVTQMIISLRKGLVEQGVTKNPKVQSYGGVASLIKELSTTMKQQGASIKSIAQMQYLICLQAGIYIPEEFITDVLVTANIEDSNGQVIVPK